MLISVFNTFCKDTNNTFLCNILGLMLYSPEPLWSNLPESLKLCSVFPVSPEAHFLFGFSVIADGLDSLHWLESRFCFNFPLLSGTAYKSLDVSPCSLVRAVPTSWACLRSDVLKAGFVPISPVRLLPSSSGKFVSTTELTSAEVMYVSLV